MLTWRWLDTKYYVQGVTKTVFEFKVTTCDYTGPLYECLHQVVTEFNLSLSLCQGGSNANRADSRELESSHVTIAFSELVAFPSAVLANPIAIDQHNAVLKEEYCELLWHGCPFYSCIRYEKWARFSHRSLLHYAYAPLFQENNSNNNRRPFGLWRLWTLKNPGELLTKIRKIEHFFQRFRHFSCNFTHFSILE